MWRWPPPGESTGGGSEPEPSSSSRRISSGAELWPEHFVEAVAFQVAVDAVRSSGRLAAAPTVAVVFQVCSTWRAASQSELLWRNLTLRVWSTRRPSLPSWRDEFVRHHLTAANFRARRYAHSHASSSSYAAASSCRRLALSDHHLAAGFLDGSVRLFTLPALQLLATYWADPHRDRLGRLSLAISGIILLAEPDERLTFASQDGDVHVVNLVATGFIRQARFGSLMEDGALVDFTGDALWWVGLFAGVPGRSWQVWSAATEELVYAGGTLMDADAVLGWGMLTDLSRPGAGRVRMAGPRVAIGCTASRLEVLDLRAIGEILNRVELRQGAVVDAVDACEDRVMVVDTRGVAKLRRVPTLRETCRFRVLRAAAGVAEGEEEQQGINRGAAEGVRGSVNWGYAIACVSDGIRVWDAATGEYMYRLRERIEGAPAVAVTANDRYIVACGNDAGLHLWDFGAA